jgi:hypothetical protein
MRITLLYLDCLALFLECLALLGLPCSIRIALLYKDCHALLGLACSIKSAASTARQIIGRRRRAIHPDTVRRRLKEQNIYSRRQYIGPILTQNHRVQRLQWARIHRRWRRQQWTDALFSDEPRFNLSTADGRKRVWRRRGERYADSCVLEHNRWAEEAFSFGPE